jgi:hypothetical protein
MKSIIKKTILALSAFSLVFIVGCKDDLEEIKTLDVSRLFSPTDIEARIVNQTSVRLTWKKVNKAISYTVEFHEGANPSFSSPPFKTVSGVLFEQLPLVVPGFAGETTYTVRISAVGPEINNSKWTLATFKTNAEQIFLPVNPEEITATSVILRWPAGEIATHLNLEPGGISKPITPSDVANGSVTVTNLVGETAYTAKLMSNDKVRGTISFTTLIDIGSAILVYPTDNLVSIIEGANPNDAFALMPGNYLINGNLNINTSLTIFGVRPTDRPVIVGTVLRMKNGAGLKMKDLVLDGATAPEGNQLVVYDVAMPYAELIIEDCLVRNYVKGVVYANLASLVESVLIKGCIIRDVECNGGDFIDFRSGMTKKFDFINNTVFNSALNRDLFRMDNATAYSGSNTAIVKIESNTFFNIISTTGTTRRVLYIRLPSHQITVRKNIFASTLANYSNQSATAPVTFNSNNYHNAPNLTATNFTVHDASNFTTYNPGFVNPSAGNFTVTHEELIFNRIGDPRWLP